MRHYDAVEKGTFVGLLKMIGRLLMVVTSPKLATGVRIMDWLPSIAVIVGCRTMLTFGSSYVVCKSSPVCVQDSCVVKKVLSLIRNCLKSTHLHGCFVSCFNVLFQGGLGVELGTVGTG